MTGARENGLEESNAQEDGGRMDEPPPTFETLPDLVLAHITSFLTPYDYLDSLLMACPSIVQRLQGHIHWPQVDLSDSLDTIRLTKIVSSSKVGVVSCVDVRTPDDVEACPLFYDGVKKLIEGEAVKELRVSQVRCSSVHLGTVLCSF